MPINHLILELHCTYDIDQEDDNILKQKEKVPEFCKKGVKHPGYHCLANECKHLAYTRAPNEIAYSDNNGESDYGEEAWIGFGGDMNPNSFEDEENYEKLKDIWEEICKRKIQESYDEYMKKTEAMRAK